MYGVLNKMLRGILLIFALGFLFQCGKNDDFVKDGDSVKDDDPSLVTLKLSTPEVTLNDVDGATGVTYTISVSRPPSAEKTIEVNLTSVNPLLEVSPERVMFTPTNVSPQTITVKRANGAVAIIETEITGEISHVITTGTRFTEFAIMNDTVNVTVRPTNVNLSTPEVTFSDVSGAVGATYTISVSRPPAAEKTVEVTLTSANSSLVVSPTVVRFTSMNARPQTITVKRANDANDIITTEITGAINHVMTTGASYDAEFTEFAMMNDTVNVRVTPYIPDSDGDGLIEIWAAAMLDNMRYDLAGTSYKTSAMDAGNDAGCPADGCNGYELMANIDLLPLLDANGNGEIDMMPKIVADVMHTVIDVGSGKDESWVPVGDNLNRFTGTFEGNGRTIANLWVNIPSSGNVVYAGLFGVTGDSAEIRNVGVISGGVSSSLSSFSYSGGLVGRVFTSSSLTITNSYFSSEGGASSSSSGFSSYSGGLVGSSDATLTIMNSYFSGSGGVSSSSSSSSLSAASGGLVGESIGTLTIMNSYFSGEGGISSSAASGGLVGESIGTLTIMNSYWNTDAPQSTDGGMTPQSPKRARGNATVDPMGAVRLTLAQLKATSGTFPDLGDAWALGTDQQLPAVKRCILDMAGMGTCASYAALLGGQR